ncbi:enoyl-CoA hydratase [Amycolatopsis bartoniae]|uniref:Enoyl-CoA hydratase n=1 Tax=Amycolatopsis bartoniae TaxID=941986 RepID=A0A8H9IVY2_9PSEU|nr:enoyl-CoA hydratase/isomerase family protein [Amycolatopsis bartoniae]MBB2939671.1 enoyl-CoA hydratase [Amycolatopsis bartoniae]TVT06224.1 enoyl-CoA hydratase/isomerase family protein [Amycolatopsis bartoniae]GHF36626.1 enoyl-CoA hydratase [Amycolatopsis bartoniae]
MSEELVRYQREGQTGLLVLDAPHRNALTPEFADAVVRQLRCAEADPDLTAVVLISAGPAFCSGADLGMLKSVGADPLAEDNFDGIGRIYGMFERLRDARLPTIAAINGGVAGAGLNLALACDLRIAADDVRLIGFGRAGVHPGGGHLAMVTRKLVPATDAALALFGQEIRADRAVSSGFAWDVVAAEELRKRALEIAGAAGTDGALARMLVRTYRAVEETQPNPRAAVLMERAAQVWSMQRRVR